MIIIVTAFLYFLATKHLLVLIVSYLVWHICISTSLCSYSVYYMWINKDTYLYLRFRGGGGAGRTLAHHFFAWVDFLKLQISWIMYEFYHLISEQ